MTTFCGDVRSGRRGECWRHGVGFLWNGGRCDRRDRLDGVAHEEEKNGDKSDGENCAAREESDSAETRAAAEDAEDKSDQQKEDPETHRDRDRIYSGKTRDRVDYD